VGRVEERKGHDKVIEALPEILRAIPEAVYVIVGVGSDLNRIKSLAQGLRVSDRVIFAGRVPDEALSRYYRTADLLSCLIEHLRMVIPKDSGWFFLRPTRVANP